jgi:hypothetical protein
MVAYSLFHLSGLCVRRAANELVNYQQHFCLVC